MDVIQLFFTEKSGWELVAVFFAIAYLLLAIRESVWCWPAALASTAIYTVIFWHVALLMDSVLNVYYMGMALYGFWVWSQSARDKHPIAQADSTSEPKEKAPTLIHSWPLRMHVQCVLAIVGLSLLSGYWLANHTQAAWPYLDSFTTWGSVITTVMVVRKVLENWIYWLVIDIVSMGLYIERGLHPTALLFFVYVIMCVAGYLAWRSSYQKQQSESNPLFASA